MDCGDKKTIPLGEMFGSNVFNDVAMRARLPKGIYKKFRETIDEGLELDPAIADVVANAMKDWAIEKGATHFCHWFQPMTGITAEKHDSFIAPTRNGQIMMEFSGKELTQGEPDASSFPSGGLRATFEARGYTVWDCTSPVFVKTDGANTTLFIPTSFASYKGEALDKKTPLLRSMQALNQQAVRVLRLLGNHTSQRVTATLGGEQEYFLIDRKFVERREDLRLAGRTLFGAPPPKGQELEDQYFGSLHERVASYMAELNTELWKLGVLAKTQHNEVAPAQHELAPVYATVNVGVDQNQLTMELMQRVARKHGFICLLHEKPFAGVNGSGKHNNWAIGTDDGINLLNPGNTPHDNVQFLVFLFAVIRAVHKYSGLLRATVATPGNDHRLGANEAPPAIVSIFLGDQLTDIVHQIKKGGASSSREGGQLRLGVTTLPAIPKDTTDRNRTSPFAFTGNKFEFRMVGSSQSLSGPNFVLNTIVAETLSEIADHLQGAKDVNSTLQNLLKQYALEHEAVIFNGDNYSPAWVREAAKRGLPNVRNCVDAINEMIAPENAAVLVKQGTLPSGEIAARHDILLENYVKVINIEAKTMLNMARRQILPAVMSYAAQVANGMGSLKAAGLTPTAQARILQRLNSAVEDLDAGIEALSAAVTRATAKGHADKRAAAFRDLVVPAMEKLRAVADGIEPEVSAEYWPLPTYADMLFYR
ncbi:MAG: glutamine synthetase III [Candidatus Marinimicrobia bacterium]|nr:glutamine synthetase III [Candidatus Neomarinimicrobiota bacterium]